MSIDSENVGRLCEICGNDIDTYGCMGEFNGEHAEAVYAEQQIELLELRAAATNLEDLKKKLTELVKELVPDYPTIAQCEVWEQLWAIKAAYTGTVKANRDLHLVICALANRLGLTEEQVFGLSQKVLQAHEELVRAMYPSRRV